MKKVSTILLAIAVTLGCSEKKSEQAPNTPDKPKEPGADKGSPSAPSTDLPPIKLELVKSQDLARGRSKNSDALKKQKAGDFDAAVALYKEALAADPGHILARYNLASAYAKSGKKEPALAILKELKAVPDCLVCRGRLVRAGSDSDFAALKSDSDFKALIGDVTIAAPAIKDAATAVIAELTSQRVPAALIHPRNPVGLKSPNAGRSVVGKASIEKALAKLSFGDASVKSCTKNCCTIKSESDDKKLHLERLCFDKDSGGVRTLRRIEYRRGAKGTASISVVSEGGITWAETEGFPAISPDGKRIAVAKTIEHGCSDIVDVQVGIYDVGQSRPAKTLEVVGGDELEAANDDAAVAKLTKKFESAAKKAEAFVSTWKSAERTFIEDEEATKGVAGDVVVTYEDAKLVVKRGGKTIYDKRHPEWVDKGNPEFEEAAFVDRLTAIYRGKDAVLVEIGYFYGPHCESRPSAYVAVSLK